MTFAVEGVELRGAEAFAELKKAVDSKSEKLSGFASTLLRFGDLGCQKDDDIYSIFLKNTFFIDPELKCGQSFKVYCYQTKNLTVISRINVIAGYFLLIIKGESSPGFQHKFFELSIKLTQEGRYVIIFPDDGCFLQRSGRGNVDLAQMVRS